MVRRRVYIESAHRSAMYTALALEGLTKINFCRVYSTVQQMAVKWCGIYSFSSLAFHGPLIL